MNTINAINKSAFLYTIDVSKKIRKSCDPLRHLGIKVFGYRKVFKDGTYLVLVHHSSTDIDHYLEKDFKLILSPGTLYTRGVQEFHYFVWPTKVPDDLTFKLAYEHNMWHGFTIFDKTPEFVECFSFAFDRSCDEQTNFFIKNINLLTKFCSHFKLISKDFIDSTDKNRLAVYKNGLPFDFFSSKATDYDEDNITEGCKLVSQRFSEFSVKLSNQESRCVELLAQGQTMKAIGHLLNISPRTVESYINNIKDKTGYHYKSQIIDCFWNNKKELNL